MENHTIIYLKAMGHDNFKQILCFTHIRTLSLDPYLVIGHFVTSNSGEGVQ